MKICLLGDSGGNIDEGMKNIAQNISKELSKKHEVLALNPLNFNSTRFWKDIEKFKPQIIHYIPGPSLKSFVLMKSISVFFPQAKYVMSAPFPQLSEISKRIVPYIKPDLIFVQSKKHVEMFRNLKITTKFIPLCGVDTEKFKPVKKQERADLRAKYGFGKDDFLILHVGHIKKDRNIGHLKALEGKNVHVIIVGSTSTGIETDVCKELKGSGCKVIAEYLPNLQEIYQISDCYVFPTVKNTNSILVPLSVLEAMACNINIISTDFGALKEYFPEVPGLQYVESAGQIYEKIKLLMSNPGKSETRKFAIAHSWDRIVKKLEAEYENVLGGEEK